MLPEVLASHKSTVTRWHEIVSNSKIFPLLMQTLDLSDNSPLLLTTLPSLHRFIVEHSDFVRPHLSFLVKTLLKFCGRDLSVATAVPNHFSYMWLTLLSLVCPTARDRMFGEDSWRLLLWNYFPIQRPSHSRTRSFSWWQQAVGEAGSCSVSQQMVGAVCCC